MSNIWVANASPVKFDRQAARRVLMDKANHYNIRQHHEATQELFKKAFAKINQDRTNKAALESALSDVTNKCKKLEQNISELEQDKEKLQTELNNATNNSNTRLRRSARKAKRTKIVVTPPVASADFASPSANNILRSPTTEDNADEKRRLSAVAIQKVFRGHLERSGLKRERQLSSLPMTSPSPSIRTPGSIRSKKRQRIGSSRRRSTDGSGRLSSSPPPMPVVKELNFAAPPSPLPREEEEAENMVHGADDHSVGSSSISSSSSEVATLSPSSASTMSPISIPDEIDTTATGMDINDQDGDESDTVGETDDHSCGQQKTSIQVDDEIAFNMPESMDVEEEDKEEKLSETQVQHELKKATKVLSDLKANWSLRVQWMNRIETLIREHNACTYGFFPQMLSKLRKSIGVQLTDLRSSIVREACRLLIGLADHLTSSHPESFNNLLRYIIPHLLQTLYVTIKVISSSGDQCLRALLERVHTAKCVEPLIKGCTDSHSEVRRSSALYLTIYLTHDHAEDNHSYDIKGITTVCKNSLVDSDKDVRKAARNLFSAIHQKWPEIGAAMFMEFEPSTKRQINRERKASGEAHLSSSPAVRKNKSSSTFEESSTNHNNDDIGAPERRRTRGKRSTKRGAGRKKSAKNTGKKTSNFREFLKKKKKSVKVKQETEFTLVL